MLLEQISSTSIRVIIDWSESEVGDRIINDIVKEACYNKSIAVLSCDPKADSLAFQLGTPAVININEKAYGVNVIPHTTNHIIDCISTSLDFELSNVVIAFIEHEKPGTIPLDLIFKYVNTVDDSLLYQLKVPLLYLCNDGSQLEWLEFDKPSEEICAAIVELATAHGIVVHWLP